MSSAVPLCCCLYLSILHVIFSINLRCNLVLPGFCKHPPSPPPPMLISVVRSRRGIPRGHPSLFALLILLPARAHGAPSKKLCCLTHIGQLEPLALVRMLRKRDGCGKKIGLSVKVGETVTRFVFMPMLSPLFFVNCSYPFQTGRCHRNI